MRIYERKWATIYTPVSFSAKLPKSLIFEKLPSSQLEKLLLSYGVTDLHITGVVPGGYMSRAYYARWEGKKVVIKQAEMENWW